ncbi:hypothetical protein Hanom_Chr12g01141671 [Helianthus anomalus]
MTRVIACFTSNPLYILPYLLHNLSKIKLNLSFSLLPPKPSTPFLSIFITFKSCSSYSTPFLATFKIV